MKNQKTEKEIFVFIANIKSGGFDKEEFQKKIELYLKPDQYKIYYTENKEVSQQIIEQNINQRIVLVGGDGTISGAIQSLVKFNKSFSIIPAGTSNVLCKELNISEELDENLKKIIYNPEEYKIDLIKTDKKYFILMTGIGYDGLIVKMVKLQGHKFLKKIVHIFYGFYAAIVYRNKKIKLKINGNEYVYKNLLIGNCKKYAGNFNLFYQAKNNDGIMDIIAFKEWNFFIAALVVLFILFNKFSYLKNFFDYYQTERCEIEYLSNDIEIQVDGDYCFEKLTYFECVKEAINIIR
ncbi:MAG TPA: diacylglycerol kinase family protein [bacterium]|nr:diacylglycerol kinase family protein [bacterium]HOL47775.1 diacylglycerol kinase family protein [bacterium]HPQ18298.1 diacylglycerol kinase family protein [bacterium]